MDPLEFLLKKAHRNTDGSLTVSSNLLMKIKKMTAKPKRSRSRKKEAE